jgi:hypothetical protein
MEPITREEYYLAKIAGTYEGNTPEPVTIEEYYLATMAGDYSGNTPQPVTRLQYYMAKVAGVWGGSIPAPVTRLEYYWAAIASGEGKVFPPVTREEHFLVLVADAYSVVLTVVTGNPALLENSKGNRGLESLTLYGKSTQGSTTGAQLLPFEVGEKREGFEVFKDGIAISGARKNDIYAVGRSGMDNESSYDDFSLLASGEYYVYSDSASVNLIVVAFRNGINITLGSSMKGVAAKIKVMDGDKFRIFLRLEEAFNGKVKAMISKTQPTASNYEPYTGGKPSPSPEYPQEIESVGDAGEISVEVCGKNLIAGRKFYGNYSNGIAYIIKLDGDVVFPYKPSYATYGICYAINALAGKKYTFSGYNLNDNASLRIAEYANLNDALDFANVIGYKFGGSADTFVTYTAKENGVIICLISGIWSSNNDLIHICTESELLQIELGSTATSYEPYKPAQKLIVPTPNGLPRIPVSSGGNYTDEKGQQWVCDEVDFKKGVYVQRIAKYISSGGENLIAPSTRDGVDQYIIAVKSEIDKNFLSFGFSNKFKCKNMFEANTFTVTDMFIYFRFAENTQTPETIREVLNGCEFWYVLATPIETPLSSADLAAYSALRTYSPTTTVINDAGAGMSVGYAKMK